jgi:NADP-dependent 3-hydroxy acid dehydrogenase YdfG
MSNVAIITGAASGFGFELSKKLLALGWVVYATDLNREALAAIAEHGAIPVKLDVTLNADFDRVVKKVIKDQNRIDLMVANAGFGSFSAVEETSPEKVRQLFEVNVFGVERSIRAVLPQMRKQRSGRIILVTSVVATVSMAGLGWYAATKHAVKAVANALRHEVKDLGIKITVVEPGTVKTGFDAVAFNNLKESRELGDYDKIMAGSGKWLGKLYKASPGPKQVVKKMLHAATAKNPAPIYPASWDVRALKVVFNLFGRRVTDSVILWLAKR